MKPSETPSDAPTRLVKRNPDRKPWNVPGPLPGSGALAALLSLLTVIVTLPPAAADTDRRIEASREYAARLQAELGARLKDAMAEGGPVSAIEVCRIEAPRIADALTEETPAARVGRTALRLRNPSNAPDTHARQVLEQFDTALTAGEEPPLTYFTTYPDGSARYMQSIVMQPMCVACHGSSLTGEVQAAIEAHYPEDEATGFEPGELRGAFVVDWPSDSANQ